MKKLTLITLSTTSILALAACNQSTQTFSTQNTNTQSKVNTMTNINPSDMTMSSNIHQKITIKSDLDFIMNMIPHHQEAVDTSEILLGKTSNPGLKAFLQNVITQQTKEIKQMRSWSQDWFKDQQVGLGIYTNMMPSLDNLALADAEKAYIEGMIDHHQGAIEMAEQILNITSRAELKQMANDIITNQTKEVDQLKEWLKQ